MQEADKQVMNKEDIGSEDDVICDNCGEFDIIILQSSEDCIENYACCNCGQHTLSTNL